MHDCDEKGEGWDTSGLGNVEAWGMSVFGLRMWDITSWVISTLVCRCFGRKATVNGVYREL